MPHPLIIHHYGDYSPLVIKEQIPFSQLYQILVYILTLLKIMITDYHDIVTLNMRIILQKKLKN